MSMHEDVARARKAGLIGAEQRWTNADAVTTLAALLDTLRAHPEKELVSCDGLHAEGYVTRWLATRGPKQGVQDVAGEDDLEFNNSRPCPPFCSGNGA